MPVKLYSWHRAAALTFVALPLGWRAERCYRTMPQLGQVRCPAELPSLSIIVPARNEADNLRHLLPTLQDIRYPGPREIIVVDDNSTDSTATVAESHGARVLSLCELPRGWLGKPHACHRGAEAASGDWLLFTDADTIHAADGPARAVAYALEHRLEGLSLFPGQTFQNWTDRMALMTALAGLFAGLQSRRAFLNGQYILLSRDAYWGSGGFAAVRGEALEDLALGQALDRQGYRVPLMNGEDVAVVRMYRDTAQAWAGLSRLGTGALQWSGPWSLATALFITALMSPLVAAIGVSRARLSRWWLPATWLASMVSLLPWAQRFGSARWAALAPVGALLVQLAALWGLLNRVVGRGISWKGRRV